MEEIPQPSCSSSDRPKRRKTPNSKYFGDDMVSTHSSQKQSRKTDTEKTEANSTHKTRQITESSGENQSNESGEANIVSEVGTTLPKGNTFASSDIQKTRQTTESSAESSDENESIVFVGDSNK